MSRRCNTRIVAETMRQGQPLTAHARAELKAAAAAARTGHCALMHKHAQNARAILNLAGR